MFYALPEMTNSAGAHTNAIFGFIKNIRQVVKKLKPAYGVVVWDGGLSENRLALLPEYKGQRPPMPDAFREQLSPLQEWAGLEGWQSIRQKGVEADDIIGTIAKRFSDAGIETLIMAIDKDFMQIVSDRVNLWRAYRGKEERVDPAAVLEKTGVRPDQIVDWLSLIGDSCDNIAGVPGVGPKTATKLLSFFGTVTAIYERIEEVVPASLREKLRQGRDLLERNQKMVRLKEQPQVPLTVEDMKITAPNESKLVEFLTKWELNSQLRTWQKPQEIQAELF